MTQQEADNKAKELVNEFNDYVNPYMGSGMLANTHDDSAILYQSKQCALIANQNELNTLARIQEQFNHKDIEVIRVISGEIKELIKVKQSIEKMS